MKIDNNSYEIIAFFLIITINLIRIPVQMFFNIYKRGIKWSVKLILALIPKFAGIYIGMFIISKIYGNYLNMILIFIYMSFFLCVVLWYMKEKKIYANWQGYPADISVCIYMLYLGIMTNKALWYAGVIIYLLYIINTSIIHKCFYKKLEEKIKIQTENKEYYGFSYSSLCLSLFILPFYLFLGISFDKKLLQIFCQSCLGIYAVLIIIPITVLLSYNEARKIIDVLNIIILFYIQWIITIIICILCIIYSDKISGILRISLNAFIENTNENAMMQLMLILLYCMTITLCISIITMFKYIKDLNSKQIDYFMLRK